MRTIRLTSFRDNVQAHMLQEFLKNEGIESMIQGEFTNQTMSYIHGMDVEVLIFEKDLEHAQAILKETFPNH